MKVGLLTFHNVVNYGAVLQCYALQQKLKKLGYDVEVIDYENKGFKRAYSPFQVTKPYLRKFIYMLYAFRQKLVRRNRFNKFYHEYLQLSNKVYDDVNIETVDGQYDVCVTGSDQVWNLELTGEDKHYFLDFISKGKKISYAASIGMIKIPEKYKKNYIELLKEFSAISVRENSAKELLEELNVNGTEVHIDPVLLLDDEDWEKICIKKNVYEKYIVVYKINKSETYEIAEKLAQLKGMKVKVIQPDKTCKVKFQKYKCASPIDFVTLFKNAQYVVTDSFHGTVFSIVFKKKFICCLDCRPHNRNSRIRDLLNMLNIENRCKIGVENVIDIDETIDYSMIDNILDDERKKAELYLRNAIN